MRRLMLSLLIGGCVVMTHAGDAVAHEEISPSTIPTGTPVFFTLNAADESNADLVKVTLTAPQGLVFGATTKEPPGWTVNRTDPAVTWTGGTVKPGRFEQWGFEIEGADQPGTLSFKVNLTHADGTSDDVTVDVTATAPGAGTATSATRGGSSSRATAALAVGIAALILALLGLALAGRRPKPVPDPAAGPPADGGQDW